MYQRAFRWRFMLEPIKIVKFETSAGSYLCRFYGKQCSAGAAGRVCRGHIPFRPRINRSPSLLPWRPFLFERMIFDLIALLIIFGSVMMFSESLQEQLETNLDFGNQIIYGSKFAIFVALGGMSVMLVIAHKPERIGMLLTKYLFFLPAKVKNLIASIVDKFSHGLQFLTDIKAVLNVGIQTLMLWVMMGVSNYFVFLAFGFDVPFEASFVLLVVVSILIMAPSTPGFVGVYHYGVVISLGLYGVSKEEAGACALVLHAAQYIVITLMGFYFLKKEHLSLKDLEENAEQEI